ncbi:hypothetical protein FACS1894166_11810 [Bacilli bacterium]|nr:hypothetical protein FACS1894166_11810 [Bacilli bacterium]
MKKNDKLQSKSELNENETVFNYNRTMTPYQVRIERRVDDNNLVVSAARYGKHKLTLEDLMTEIIKINERLDQNSLKP